MCERVPAPLMSAHVKALWAKVHPNDPNCYHPLVCHLLDVAAVAEALWDQALPAGIQGFLTRALNLQEDAATRAWLSFLAGLHDLGKASPAFQSKSPQHREALEAHSLRFPPGVRAPHGQVGARLIADVLAVPANGCPALARTIALPLAKAIGGHHGIVPGSGDLNALTPATGELGDGAWAEARRGLLDVLIWSAGMGSVPAIGIDSEDRVPVLALVAGIISVADWIGSAEDHFPYCPDVSDIGEYATIARERANVALREIGWLASQPEPEAKSLHELFPFIDEPRPMQQATVELAEQIDAPSIVIVEAPTGEGKTEAALYLANCFNGALGQRGCYVGMPTQATANAMFTRFKEYLKAARPAQAVDLHLLHGQAALSNEYQQLRDISQVHDEGGATGVLARSWFTHRKRGLLGPFAVGTGDQAFMGVLRARHVFVRLFGLASKTIVFDEVHAYDTYTSTILDRLVSWLSALGSSVIILSATLPKARRNALLAAYAGREIDTGDAAYPCITWATADGDDRAGFAVAPRPSVSIKWVPDSRSELATRLGHALAGGGCAACICNTVASAQDTYQALRAAFEDADIELDLFHARYPFAQRQAREERAVRRFGKDAKDRPERAVLVATQVIEQSLDIDFDLMVSEVAPVDLLIQRAGRLHRHADRVRPTGLEQPVLWLLQPPAKADGGPDFGYSAYVYAEYTLLRTMHELAGRPAIRVPDDVSALIEAIYRDLDAGDADDDAEAAERLARAFADMEQQRFELDTRAREVVLKAPEAPVDISSITDRRLSDADDPAIHPQLRAATRWSDRPSITVCILHGSTDEWFLDAEHTRPVPLDDEPDRDTIRALIGRSVSLSGWNIHTHFVDAEVPGWRGNALLRHLRVVPLDDTGSYSAERFTLTLHPELGVIVDHAGKGGDVD